MMRSEEKRCSQNIRNALHHAMTTGFLRPDVAADCRDFLAQLIEERDQTVRMVKHMTTPRTGALRHVVDLEKDHDAE